MAIILLPWYPTTGDAPGPSLRGNGGSLEGVVGEVEKLAAGEGEEIRVVDCPGAGTK